MIFSANRVFRGHNSAEEINQLLAIPGMDLDLAEKYSAYIARKQQVKKTGRSNGSYRDSNRRKVYQSEWAFQKQVDIRKFRDIKSAEKRMNQIQNSKLWEQLNGRKVYLVTNNRMGRATAGRAHYGRKIELGTTGMDEYTLIHEMTHQLPNCMHHDVEFRKNLLRLVSRFMGTEAASILKGEFRSRKLKLALSTGIKSPEDWLKSYLKMEAVRSQVGRT